MLVKKEFEVASSGLALGEAVGNILKATATALKDGFQVGQDVPVIVTSALSSLMAVAAEMKNIPEEAKANPFDFGKGVVIPIIEGVEEILKK